MIKAEELMLGNLLTDEFYDGFKTIIKVDSINEKGINLEINDDGNYPECAQQWIEPVYKFDELYGILLTEEILLKAGFETTYSSKFRLRLDHSNHSEIGFDFLHTTEKSMDGFRFYGKYIKIQHVHNLQNLYYALTGKQLQINL